MDGVAVEQSAEAPAQAPVDAGEAAVEPPVSTPGPGPVGGAVEAPVASAWVLSGDRAERALRVVRRAGAERVVPLPGGLWCAELPQGIGGEPLRDKVERKLDGPIEARMSCDVAHYPLGRGFVVLLVGAPSDGLEAALDAHHPAYREVVRPDDPAEWVRVCLPGLAVGDPLVLVHDLRERGFWVHGAYEVGGCRR